MKLTLPTSWSKVSVGDFIEIVRMREVVSDELEILIEIIAILSKQDRDVISRMDFASLKKVSKAISFLDEFNASDKIEPKIKVNGITYVCHFDISRITGDQYVDYKNNTRSDKDIINNMHRVLACLYVQEGRSYSDKDYHMAEVAEIFYEHMPITVAYPAALFFWNLFNAWSNHILLSSEKNLTKNLRKILEEAE